MRNLLLVTTLALATAGWIPLDSLHSLGASQTGSPAAFDPAGKWTYTSQDEQGAQVSGTITITGKAGAYTGAITTTEGQNIPVTDVFTASNGMVILFSLADGATGVVKVTRTADGKMEAGWAPVRNVIAAKIERAK